MKKLTDYSDICDMSLWFKVRIVRRSAACVQTSIVNGCTLHVQYHHVADVVHGKAAEIVRSRAVHVAGGYRGIQVAVDGRQSEVD